MSRGLNNRNPGNIRISQTKYLGEVLPSQDKAFKQFTTMAYGYRAMFMLLYTYQKRHGLNTLRRIINRYAPPTENDTDSYVKAVAHEVGISPDVGIDTLSKQTMTAVVAAMSRVENGVPAVTADVVAGWELFIAPRT